MTSSNYLVEFLYGVDVLLSEINKLDSKIRMYKRNSEMFGIEYEVKFSVSPDNFVKLRDFLQKRIDEGARYDRNIINLSVRLIHFDKRHIEAVLWHELLHFIIPNHSKRFHEILALYLPDYEKIIKEIR